MDIKAMETAMWEAAKNCDVKAFEELVCENAVIVCGGYRCSGKEYAGYIADFGIVQYEYKAFETVLETEDIIQVHYVVATKTDEERQMDLEGIFHVTTTWRKLDGRWRIIFNMDSRIIEDEVKL